MSLYAIAHIIHLYCAIAFVGGVFFEMLVLSVMHTGRVSRESRREVERAMSYRAVRVMPPVVITLFISGIVMVFNRYLPFLSQPFATSFGTLLTLKILLAVSVLVHFAIAVVKNGTAHPDRRLVQIHPRRRIFPYAVYRIFAKAMVLLSW